ncbi:purine-binding chemotaxis protein CheW [Endozoicomonas sp. SM1973]|uniref:Chemotaxis protein CheW n=1 Tax=Spartinivicinus marinus TaxID=2994442 RepID=A0A853I054_9GAMM|nr:chemotaxis protein CheW [Spartinivicinus marinus]MCX4025268.1 chemotaxis protein CheW [Spartinivicinus marinus]NYZ65989.1 purine-binding chemotaxis protein CheW [Spartinivicinus marinus]
MSELKREYDESLTADNNIQYLTFTLADELYAVDILRVKEIRGWEQPTLIPNAPDYIKGLINIRGMIIPVMDLRLHFSIGSKECTSTTVVIVLSIKQGAISRTMGIVVDTVADVVKVAESALTSALPVKGEVSADIISGMINIKKKTATVLATEKLFELKKFTIGN